MPCGFIPGTLSRHIRTQRLSKYFISRRTHPLKRSKPDVCLLLCSRRGVVRAKRRPLDYELVKIYHPDVVSASLSQCSPPPGEQIVSSSVTQLEEHLTQEVAQARFQAVTKAYDSLRKGKAKGKAHLGANHFTDATESRISAKRKRELRARAELRVGDDEKWRERLIVGALFAVSGIVVYFHASDGMLNSFTDDGDFRVSNIRDKKRRVSSCRSRKFTGERKEEIARRDPCNIPPTERPNHWR
jgi:curved DNA-binding protein CbpA